MEKPIHLEEFSPASNAATLSRPTLSVQARVNMEAERLLRLVVFCQERAEYQLAGFAQPVVKVVDYRPASIQAMAQVIKTGRRDVFLARFNLPARLILWADYPRQIRIELREIAQALLPYTFWIAQNAPPAAPLYPSIFRHSARLERGGCIQFAIYRRGQMEETYAPEHARAI